MTVSYLSIIYLTETDSVEHLNLSVSIYVFHHVESCSHL